MTRQKIFLAGSALALTIGLPAAASADQVIAGCGEVGASGVICGDFIHYLGTDLTNDGFVAIGNGTIAGAIQAGVSVAPKASFNLGVAKGFNKGGDVGARAGFSFGL